MNTLKENKIELGFNTLKYLDEILINQDYFLCIDKNVYNLHFDSIEKYLKESKAYIIIEALESNKTQEYLNKLYKLFNDNEADRNSFVVCIGGGIINDLGGYASATYMRGLKLINVPTTLLACVDSSIGGKVAINMHDIKNLIGTFYQPYLTIIDLVFLETLTTRLFKEGLVELIKHGLLQNKNIITVLNSYENIDNLRNDRTQLLELIERALLVKLDIVSKDFYDKDIRQQLNLGHSIAHCLELDDNNDYYHGECVAIGILLALTLNDDFKNNSIFLQTKDLFEKFECIKPLNDINFSKLKSDKKKNNNKIIEIELPEINEVKLVEYDIDDLIVKYQKNYELLKALLKTTDNEFIFKHSNLKGEVKIPPSKSLLHRYLLAAFLSRSFTVLNNVTSLCDDIKTSIDILKTFGTTINYQDNKLTIDSRLLTYQDKVILNMKESASTLRIFLPTLLNYSNNLTIIGENKLPERPLKAYLDIFDENNIAYKQINKDNYLPLMISGTLKQQEYHLSGKTSSQYISGLLFALPLLEHDSIIKIIDDIESLPYLKLTIQILKEFSIVVDYDNDYKTLKIKGNQNYKTKEKYEIEQDYSARSYFEFLNEFNNDITFKQEKEVTLQGDAKIIEIIKNKQQKIDVSNIPDAAPLLALYLTTIGGSLKNIERLKYKESNRLKAITDFLKVMAINYKIEGNCLIIEKGLIKGGSFNTYRDHRIVMILVCATALCNDKIILNEIESINKSFPDFVREYLKIGGFYDEK